MVGVDYDRISFVQTYTAADGWMTSGLMDSQLGWEKLVFLWPVLNVGGQSH